MIAAERQCARVGRGAPRHRATAKRIAPAARKRVPAMRKGGSVSIAIRMAR